MAGHGRPALRSAEDQRLPTPLRSRLANTVDGGRSRGRPASYRSTAPPWKSSARFRASGGVRQSESCVTAREWDRLARWTIWAASRVSPQIESVARPAGPRSEQSGLRRRRSAPYASAPPPRLRATERRAIDHNLDVRSTCLALLTDC